MRALPLRPADGPDPDPGAVPAQVLQSDGQQGDGLISCGASSASAIPSSASALVRMGSFGRKMTYSQHALLLGQRFEATKRKWDMHMVLQEMQIVDPSAKLSMAKKVLRKLREPSILSPAFNISLLHGIARSLCDQGCGIVFHMVNASTVASMIEDIARKKWTAYCKKHQDAKKIPFSIKNIAASVSLYSDDKDVDNKFIIGYTLVPVNMMYGNLANFIPVDAIDGANMREDAAGTMFIRATKDANDHIHPISISILIASECNAALNAVMHGEQELLRLSRSKGVAELLSPLDSPGRVTITDGGPALMSTQKDIHPSTALWRCEHHLKADLRKRCKSSLPIYEELLQIPFGREREATELMDKLPPNSPLRKIPKEQICQAFLKTSLFGNKTNNFAEISNHMFESARNQKELSNSLLAVAAVLKTRHKKLRTKVLEHKAKSLYKPVQVLRPSDTWPEHEVTESVFKAHSSQADRAHALTDVTKHSEETSLLWDVKISKELVYQVDLACLETGKYHMLCSCGRGGLAKLWCRETQAVFYRCNTNWRSWVHKWNTAETWELQIGADFQVPGGQEIIEGLIACHDGPGMLSAKQPNIRPTAKGRPATINSKAADQRREKSILESVQEAPAIQGLLGEAATGGSSYNPGGRNVSKKCSLCKSTDHRRPQCPKGREGNDRKGSVSDTQVAGQLESVENDNDDVVEAGVEGSEHEAEDDEDDDEEDAEKQEGDADEDDDEEDAEEKEGDADGDDMIVDDAERETSTGLNTDVSEVPQLTTASPNDQLRRLMKGTQQRRVEQASQVQSCVSDLSKRMDIGIRVNPLLVKMYGVHQDSSVQNLTAKELKAKITELGVKPKVGPKKNLVTQLQDLLAASSKKPECDPPGPSSKPASVAAESMTTTRFTATSSQGMEAGPSSGVGTDHENLLPRALPSTLSSRLGEEIQLPTTQEVYGLRIDQLRFWLGALGESPKGRKKEALVEQLIQALVADDLKNLEYSINEDEGGDAMEEEDVRIEGGFDVFDVIRDGSSFFRCVALHLRANEHACSLYRELVTQRLRVHVDFIVSITGVPEGLTTRDVIESIAIDLANTESCVTEEILALSAKVIGLNIVVHDGKLNQKQFLGPDHTPYSNPAIHLFFDGEFYAYLRPRTPEVRPVRPDRHAFGDLYCNVAQERFDHSLLKWKFDCESFDASMQAWAERTTVCATVEALPVPELRSVAASSGGLEENVLDNGIPAVRTADELRTEVEASTANVESESRALPETSSAPPRQCFLDKHWKKRGNGRLSSSLYSPVQQVGQSVEAGHEGREAPEVEEDQAPWMFFIRRELDGSEKGCLLLSGAQELSPESPLETLKPLGVDDAFSPRSTLTSFWNMMMDPKKIAGNEFYFVRKSGDVCDGVMLLRMMSRGRVATSTKVTVDIIRCCASGVKGNGSLLVFHLCSLLYLLEPQTEVRVSLRSCLESSRGFWTKMGFAAPGERPEKRSKKTFVADELTLNVAERETWEAYLAAKNPTLTISDDEVGRAASVNVELLRSLWSELHASAWLAKFDRIRGARVSTIRTHDDVVAAIKTTKTRIASVSNELIGTRVTVKGNGTCWLYAVMAGFGDMLEHANPCAITNKQQLEKKVTKKDYHVSRILINQMKAHVLANFNNLPEETLLDLRTEMQGIEAATTDRKGTYGGGFDSYCILSNLLGLHIVCLDLSRPDVFFMFNGAETCRREEIPMDELESKLFMLVENVGRFVVVEFNGEHGTRAGHFAGYWPPPSRRFEIPSFLRSAFPGLTHLAYVAGPR